MKNTLTDLNNYLFEQLERLNDDDLTGEQLDRELQKTDSIVKISEKIIENGELAFKTMKHLDEFGYHPDKSIRSVPPMLTTEGKW
ncbi:hypothetical protein D7X98_12620 [bacterium 1XD8-76]|nr:hypothetical protein D7X98_12620 [bacterium 1XD8-76]